MVEDLLRNVKILSEKGYYSEEDLEKEAYRALLKNKPELRVAIAIEKYKEGGLSLNKTAEIAGITTEELKEKLAERGIKIRRGLEGDEKKEERAQKLAEEF
ncbi:hypothetical protein AKJ50_01075 [candidate division MSBL1 archaeon SCGC-AAA382A13]|uniref:Uncharacterized protein n=1 Tax=candidate division MSBL1 archaeon SCGC-AAA382A13 TaxID=1698279 RepID=A0A133VG40_9EURY|nr:hypothetical protein AKJ50_01075 [candidate division MSBL1 archaeon SCGC-AAA382A13]